MKVKLPSTSCVVGRDPVAFEVFDLSKASVKWPLSIGLATAGAGMATAANAAPVAIVARTAE